MRRWLKLNVLPRLGLIGFWRFLYMYFFRLGFLDGLTGFRFCLLLAAMIGCIVIAMRAKPTQP